MAFRYCLLGLLLGLVFAAVQPRAHTAEVTLYFPGVDTHLFSQLTQALRAEPIQSGLIQEAGPDTRDLAATAAVILQSQAAASSVLKDLASVASLTRFQSRLVIEEGPGSSLRLHLEAGSAEAARLELQALLEYYNDFVKRNPLTRVGRTRRKLDKRLLELVKHLRGMEQRLSRSRSAELQKLGDKIIRADPKLMRQIWLKRAEEQQKSRELLNKLQRIREEPRTATSAEEKWLQEWAQGKKSNPPVSRALQMSVRPQELLERARLEREYYEALLQYRSLALQQSFFLTWETLESSDFEIIDPIVVKRNLRDWLRAGTTGAVLGLIIGFTALSLRSAGRIR